MSSSFHNTFITALVYHRLANHRFYTQLGLSDGQPKVLDRLLSCEGSSQKDLAEKCNVRPATMTALLRKMLDDGLVYRKSLHAENGKRVFGIFLTEVGRDIANRLESSMDEITEQSLKGFTQEERDAFFSYLERMSENLRNA